MASAPAFVIPASAFTAPFQSADVTAPAQSGAGGTTTPAPSGDSAGSGASTTNVPEPGSFILVGSGVIGLAAARRLRHLVWRR